MAAGSGSPWFVSKAEFTEVDNIKDRYLWISYEGVYFQTSDIRQIGAKHICSSTLDNLHLNEFY